MSQLDLAIEAGVSARHVSFVETGRARPSREMVLRLADQLDVPLRDRNPLLLAAGFAPSYVQRPLDDPDMASARTAIDLILTAYEPYPALVVDRGWNIVAANSSVGLLMAGVAPELVEPPVNMLRLVLHPLGMASQILNLAELRGQILDRVNREAAATGAAELAELHRELIGYPGGIEQAGPDAGVAVPVVLRFGDQELSFIGTVTTFGTAVDITLAELSIEAFLPADSVTARALQDMATATT